MPEITEKELLPNQKSLWLKAISAIQTSNVPYAISLIQTVLKDNPGFLEGRKMLRKCELQLAGGAKKKAGLFGMTSNSSKFHSQAKKDPGAVIPLIEKELETDPSNPGLNDALFEAAVNLQMFDTATFALETVRKHSPENTKLLHKLAEFYVTREKPLEASEVYTDILKQNPADGVAVKAAKDCSARASMQKAKWDENADMRSLMKNAAEFEELEKNSRTGLTKDQLEERRDKIVERYNSDPNNLANVKDLANIYEQLEDWHNAHTFFTWAHTLSNGDVALAHKAQAMNDKALQQDLVNLEAGLAADPGNEDLQRQLAERKSQRLADQIQEAQQRVDQNPTDPQLRYELGNALYNAGDYTAAIPHLQQATRNPHIRTKVLLMLGRTFKAKNMFDIAIKQLADALADLVAMDGTKKEVLYEKGLIHDQVGDKAAAIECFKQIYEVDYGYRDVAQRVESSYA